MAWKLRKAVWAGENVGGTKSLAVDNQRAQWMNASSIGRKGTQKDVQKNSRYWEDPWSRETQN